MKKYLICEDCLYHLKRNWLLEKGVPISLSFMMCREKPKCFFKAEWKGRKEEDILKLHLKELKDV